MDSGLITVSSLQKAITLQTDNRGLDLSRVDIPHQLLVHSAKGVIIR